MDLCQVVQITCSALFMYSSEMPSTSWPKRESVTLEGSTCSVLEFLTKTNPELKVFLNLHKSQDAILLQV